MRPNAWYRIRLLHLLTAADRRHALETITGRGRVAPAITTTTGDETMIHDLKMDLNERDGELVQRIANRASTLMPMIGRSDVLMNVTICHRNGCPLDLMRLADAADFDFIHDVAGIQRHLEHATGALTDCFLPRYALPENPGTPAERAAVESGDRGTAPYTADVARRQFEATDTARDAEAFRTRRIGDDRPAIGKGTT